jgi:hypothetical protein
MVFLGGLPKVLMAKIDRSPGNFDTAPEIMKQLKVAGVHDSIILARRREEGGLIGNNILASPNPRKLMMGRYLRYSPVAIS